MSEVPLYGILEGPSSTVFNVLHFEGSFIHSIQYSRVLWTAEIKLLSESGLPPVLLRS